MKLLISASVEKSLFRLGFSIEDLVEFFRENFPESSKCIPICAPLPDTVVYKAYLDGVTRMVVFSMIGKSLVYPVYVGDKRDPIARNVTVSIIRNMAERWQADFLHELRNKRVKVRHVP